MESSELLEIASKAGELLLKSGAEIYRVEDTIEKIFKAYGRSCESFVLLTGIFIYTKEDNNRDITIIKRIKDRSFNLNCIEMVNEFSRSLYKKQISYTEAKSLLENIEKTPGYSFITQAAAAGFTAFVYTLLFKGNYLEGTIALLITVIIHILKAKITEIGFFDFLNFFISGMIVAGATLAAAKLYPGINIYKVIIGGVMILLPGMAITNSVKDALHGDIVSSLYRLIEAIFTLIGAGAGVGFILSIGLHST